MAMFATYVASWLVQKGLPFWAAFVITLACAFVGGVVIERAIVRWVEHAPVLSVVIVFIGLLVICNSLAAWIFGSSIVAFPSPFPSDAWYGSIYLAPQEVGMIAVTVLVLVCVFLFFRFTRLGLAMRAAAENAQSSRLVGVRVGWMLALGWGLAALLGAVAGMMTAPVVYLSPNMMEGVLLYGFAAALLGGIDNPWGAAVGGFIVGVLDNLAGAYVVGTQLKQAVALMVIVGVVTFKPAGLFGRAVVARV
jgi:branched-chain amino acid transport system permease protein